MTSGSYSLRRINTPNYNRITAILSKNIYLLPLRQDIPFTILLTTIYQ